MWRSLPSLLSSPLSFLRPLPSSFLIPPPPSSHRPVHFYSSKPPPATTITTGGEKAEEKVESAAEKGNEVFFTDKYLKYKYALNSQVMARLPRFHRESDAKRASIALHGNEEALEKVREQKATLDMHRLKHLQKMLQKKNPTPHPSPPPKSTLSPSLSYELLQNNHHQPPPKEKRVEQPHHQTPSIKELWEADGSSRTVLIAIFGNFCVMGSKLGGFLMTGSASLLSEAIHSFADLGNQVLLAVGVQKSKKRPDSRHPYGYSHERYIWALISGVGIFFLGCGVSMYHGVTQLLEPTPISSPSIAFGTLAFAFVVEGMTFLLAARQVQRSARQLGVSFREYVQRGPDPMGVAVLAEDGAAVLGVGIAGLCIGASQYTGDMRWDGVGSLAIGSIMAIVAVFLVHKNREILLGQSIPQAQMNKILRHLENEKIIKEVKDVKALMIGSDSMRFKAEIHFHGSVLAETYLKQHVDSEALLSSLETTEQLDEFLIQYGAGLTESDHSLRQFIQKYRNVLNEIVRKTPGVLEGSLSSLTNHAKFLDFDNKRSYFRKRLDQESGTHYGTLKLRVNRDSVFEESYHQLSAHTPEELRIPLSVDFVGEQGIDAGGVRREWFLILSREMFNENYALFTSYDGLTFQPNPSSGIDQNHLQYFRFIGRVVGKAILDNQLLDAHFTPSFYKHILKIPVTFEDIEGIDPDYYRSLKVLLDSDNLVSSLDLTFSVMAQEFGRSRVVDLIENGRDVTVTEENKAQYVQLLCNHRMTNGIQDQIDSFLGGFYDVIPQKLISIFNERELELLISGLPDIDIDDWQANTDYMGTTAQSPVVLWFWEVVRSLGQAELALLLQFVTGTSKVPLEGFKALVGMSGPQRFNIHLIKGASSSLPSSHTCSNQLDLPMYKTKKELETKLLMAVRETSGFGFA